MSGGATSSGSATSSGGATSSGSESHRDKRQKMDPGPSSQSEEKIEEINRKITADRLFQTLEANEQDLDALLLIFSRHAKEHLRDLEQMRKLLDEKEDLKERLMTGWRNKSFEEILKLDYLQRSTSSTWPTTHPGVQLPASELEYIQRAIQVAWNLPYEGDCHRLLHCNINDMKKRDPYTNICSIIQSSGTGKSRMVDEQAKLVFTIPMNIRKEETRAAYPRPDKLLCDFFVMAAYANGTADAVKEHYLAFFSSLFCYAAEELKRVELSLELPSEEGSAAEESELSSQSPSEEQFAAEEHGVELSPQLPSEEQLATKWREKMCNATYRRNFYKEVITLCETMGKFPKSQTTKDQLSEAIQTAKDSLHKLVEALEQRVESTNSVKIVIYIDEAHALDLPASNDKNNPTGLDILCSAVAEFSYLPLFCLLLSTQSSLQLLAPPSRDATSERARQGSALRAPITETPFDCAPDMKISPGKLRLDDLSKIDYLAKWGRPLWWTFLEGDEPDREAKLTRLLNFARAKLLRRGINVPFSELEPIAQVAVVDVLLGLDFEPGREQINRQAELVASYMRTAYSVPQHREYFRSGYPSEPLLAEAAAQQIYEFQSRIGNEDSDVMVKILAGVLDRGWIDLGQRGEVVKRLLLMRGYMDGVREDYPDSPLIFSRGCRLITFINNLFSHESANKILDSKPDNVKADTTFREAFKASVVRFTHFVKAGDESVLTTEALFAAFARGMAFICHQTQKYVDFMIPVLLEESDGLEEAAMTAVMIQVKRRAKARSGQAYAFTQEDVGLFPDGGSSNRPYFVLIAELTGRKDAGQDTRSKKKGKAKASAKPSPVYVSPQPEVIRHSHSTHPRYLAAVYGCSGDLYKSIGANHNRYEQLLASRNFLDEHSRQNAESRSAVMRLKPLWKYGKDSYHWVESKVLNNS